MAANGSSTATISPRDSLTSSQFMSSSISSLSNSTSSRHAPSQISKIYRQASTLFLTRRLPESLSTILPVITAAVTEDTNGNSQAGLAPIATASRTTRIKVWSLYLTILNAIVELDPEEGKSAFGTQEWRSLVTKVREGGVWEEVVSNGYGGVEGDVDADVVINLATILLAHARTQLLNQQRLENYLAASTQPNLDITSRMSASQDSRQSRRGPSPAPSRSGTETPRDLNARVKILELYTLHVLLRNNEWEYAREFISVSEVLDEERREAFLQALQSLQDEQAEHDNREAEALRQHEEQLKRDLEEAKQRRVEEEERERLREEERQRSPKRAPSEIDYGIDDSYHGGSANGSSKAKSKGGSAKGAASKSVRNGSSVSHAPKPASPSKKTVAAPGVIERASAIITNLRKLLENMAASFQTNPLLLLRFLAFIVIIVVAFSRRGVRERLRRMWEKVRATAGMGVKVSYI